MIILDANIPRSSSPASQSSCTNIVYRSWLIARGAVIHIREDGNPPAIITVNPQLRFEGLHLKFPRWTFPSAWRFCPVLHCETEHLRFLEVLHAEEVMTTILTTTSLGDIRGKTVDGVTQFLGIKYATLKNRFADAELIEQRNGDVLDATTDG